MKNKTKIQTLWVALVVLIVAVTYLWKNPRVVTKPVTPPPGPPPCPLFIPKRGPPVWGAPL